MTSKMKAPSRVEAAPTPLFGLFWFGDPSNGTSIVAACGGGGSAATGVKNLLTIKFGLRDDTDPKIIETGDQVGNSLFIAKNPISNKINLFCSLGSKLCVYSILTEEAKINLEQEMEIGERINAVATNAMVDEVAIGCDSGAVKVYKMKQDSQLEANVLYECGGHTAAICAVAFAPRSNFLVSSARDGTARVWKGSQCLGILNHIIDSNPRQGQSKRKTTVLVRGCGFGDLEGKIVYTAASGKRGKAFLYKWGQKDLNAPDSPYQCIERSEVSGDPVMCMSVSADAATIAVGGANGNAILWNAEKWKAIKSFPEVHGLPVTCIAVRPFDVPLQGEEQSLVKYNVVTASADSKMGWLTLQRRNPKQVSSGFPVTKSVNFMVRMAFLCWILSPLASHIWETCGGMDVPGVMSKFHCIRDDVLIAPMSRPGIAVPPH